VGITDSLTAGFRAEGTPALVSAGPVVNARLWRYGEIELALGASRQHGRTGGAYSVGYSYNARRVSVAGSVRSYSSDYATLSLSGRDARPAYEANAMLGIQVSSRMSVTVNHSQLTTRGAESAVVAGGRERRTWVSARSQIGGVGLFASATRRTAAGIVSNDVEVGVSLSLGARTSAMMTGSAGAAPGHMRAEVQHALPMTTGVGYRLRMSDQPGGLGGALLQYQNRYGRYEVEQVQAGGTYGTTLRAAGGLVAIGGGVFATRPVEESFALVRVPGVAGVRGYASNQEIGRTDRDGNLLIPNLLPYYGNIVSVNDQDIPLDYKLGELLQRVAPPFRSGAVVTFSATRVLAVTGTVSVEVAGEAVVPAYGQLTVVVAGRAIDSPIGQLGEFYLEGIPPGRHQATLEYRGGTGTCVVDVPLSTAVVVRLGKITCKGEAGQFP
jgi:outer membrane usher protein